MIPVGAPGMKPTTVDHDVLVANALLPVGAGLFFVGGAIIFTRRSRRSHPGRRSR